MEGKAAVIGVFDGVHKGHAILIDILLKEASRMQLVPFAITFDPPPALFFNPYFSFLLTTSDEKKELLASMGLKRVDFIDFRLVANKEPEDFIRDELIKRGIKLIVIGEGFRFGHKRRGDAGMLEEIGNFTVLSVKKECFEGDYISSTRIRELLLLGHVHQANILLGYEYALRGLREKGIGRAGSVLNTPTVNMKASEPHKLVPADSIYAVRFGSSRKPGVCYIGSSPTFGDGVHKIEVHLLDGPPDESEEMVVRFVARLRPDMRFDSVEALRLKVKEDVERARRLLSLS